MQSTDGEDQSFLALSTRLRHRIDDAFDSVVASGTQSHQSRFEIPAGGFVVDQPKPGPSRSTECEPGGFVVEDVPSNSSGATSYVPLSEVPRALSLLDLYPDDDIMGVFKNATTGWGAHNACNDGVSRKDWRAICAALLEEEHVEGNEKEYPAGDEDAETGANGGLDSDEYQTEELSGDTEGASSDALEEPNRAAARGRGSQQIPHRTLTKNSGTEMSRQLTEFQRAQCRQDFGRFFPHVPDNELDRQRIMVKDITRIGDLLKENLKTDEVLEMLEAFSTSPDKSMNLADFEHMMVLTKLV